MSKVINAVNLIDKMTAIFKAGVTEVANQKTVKYLTGSPDFTARLTDVVTTIVGLMSSYGSVVTVNNVTFNITDYKVPTKLVDLIDAGRIYGSVDSVGRVNPLCEVEQVQISLTPLAFNKFFSDFNYYQGEGSAQFSLTEGYVRSICTLENFQYLEDGAGRMCKLHESGYNIEVCALIGLRVDELTECLSKYDAPTSLGLGLWLLS